MQVIALLKAFIFLVSSSLLLPVLFTLSFLFCWILVQAGGLLYEWIQRRRLKLPALPELLSVLEGETEPPGLLPPARYFLKQMEKITHGKTDMDTMEIRAASLLEAAIHELKSNLSPLKIVIRVGPGLGLIGTLIPMGTGLSALGQGDMARLSSDLVVAFTTTVLGLFEGLLAYFFFTVRARWLKQDASCLELISEYLLKAGRKDGRQVSE